MTRNFETFSQFPFFENQLNI